MLVSWSVVYEQSDVAYRETWIGTAWRRKWAPSFVFVCVSQEIDKNAPMSSLHYGRYESIGRTTLFGI